MGADGFTNYEWQCAWNGVMGLGMGLLNRIACWDRWRMMLPLVWSLAVDTDRGIRAFGLALAFQFGRSRMSQHATKRSENRNRPIVGYQT